MPMTPYRAEVLDVPGGKVYYEVRGAGPVLLMMPGGPADAGTFRAIEDELGKRHTVVTYDPRGLSNSSPFPESDDSRMVQLFADDCHRLLRHVAGDAKSSVFASSGGATIALELAARHHDELDTVILHEPPSPSLTDDPAKTLSAMEHVCDTCAREGVRAAMGEFAVLVGMQGGPPQQDHEPTPEEIKGMAQMMSNMNFFLGRYVRNIARYQPDFAALKKASCRLVPAYGAESTDGQLARNGSFALARILGVEPARFPGDHGGFFGRPAEFAARLREVLSAQPAIRSS
jgi:pimeloyl-ACP methyl ester carboxylesterase